jgi:hypothetical protein
MVANRESELADSGADKVYRPSKDDRHTVVGVFDNPADLDRAYAALIDARFSKEHISLVGRGTDAADEIPNQDASDRATAKAVGGAAVGGVGGGALALLAGASALAIPGVGPVLVAVGGALAGAAAGGWLGSIGIGVSDEVETKYNALLSQGKYLMFVRTDDLEADHDVRRLLEANGANDTQAFPYNVNPPDVNERPGANP